MYVSCELYCDVLRTTESVTGGHDCSLGRFVENEGKYLNYIDLVKHRAEHKHPDRQKVGRFKLKTCAAIQIG